MTKNGGARAGVQRAITASPRGYTPAEVGVVKASILELRGRAPWFACFAATLILDARPPITCFAHTVIESEGELAFRAETAVLSRNRFSMLFVMRAQEYQHCWGITKDCHGGSPPGQLPDDALAPTLLAKWPSGLLPFASDANPRSSNQVATIGPDSSSSDLTVRGALPASAHELHV